MCVGIALAVSEVPVEFMNRHCLRRRVHERGGEAEVRFLYRDRERVLPVWHEGRLVLARWGCRKADGLALPLTGWTWKETVEQGTWADWHAVAVDIPATMGLEGGVWFQVQQGIRGVLVEVEGQLPVVYLMTEPASHYYRTMTRSDRMPVLIGERI